jgi:hypothetical protein
MLAISVIEIVGLSLSTIDLHLVKLSWYYNARDRSVLELVLLA